MLYADFYNLHPNAAQLVEARQCSKLTRDQAADLVGLHRTTYARQESGISKVSLSVYRLLLTRTGWLPAPFDGWSIGQGKLWTPQDICFSPGEIQAIPQLFALIADLERRIKETSSFPGANPSNVIPFRRR